MDDVRTLIAAKNNADFYEAMFRSHGRAFERRRYAFVGKDGPPPYHSNLTVLEPGCQDEVVLALRELAPAFRGTICFKDSFCEFDLEAEGFRSLFGAQWIWSAPASPSCPDSWTRIDHPRDLLAWEAAWKRDGSPTPLRMFDDELLNHPSIAFFGERRGEEFVAGCIANKSAECVGLSNIFSGGDLIRCVGEAKAAVASFAPGLPIVGYAIGPLLHAAEQAGFAPIGDLQVLLAERARFQPRFTAI